MYFSFIKPDGSKGTDGGRLTKSQCLLKHPGITIVGEFRTEEELEAALEAELNKSSMPVEDL